VRDSNARAQESLAALAAFSHGCTVIYAPLGLTQARHPGILCLQPNQARECAQSAGGNAEGIADENSELSQ